jgi:hypothetical protein
MGILVRKHLIPAYSLNGAAPGKGRKEYRIKASDLDAYLERLGWTTGWAKGADAAIRWLESLGYGKR